ncbi:MAG TPA: DedA family protein [Burkholderiales bacterium]|nr:DedA family protein [Burkholderiales bacterium]
MNLPELIQTYGYGAVFAGTLLEAEAVLLVAGFVAHRGYLDLPTLVGVAIAGSFLANQIWFYLGRWQGAKLLERFPRYLAPAARAHELLARYNTPLILTVRFIFGLRTVLPFVLGMGKISTLRFQVLNLGGAVFWSVTVAAGGYLFGHLFERALGDLRHYEEVLLAVLACGGALFWLYSRRRRA